MLLNKFNFEMSTAWYVDFEGYHFDHRYFVKEIAILNKDTLKCYNYFVLNPCCIPECPNTQTTNFQYNRHKLSWRFGDHNFLETMMVIASKVKSDVVFAKGREKVKFLKRWLPQIEEMTWIATPFKNLYNCVSEICEVKHGYNCARRKVHELRYVDCMYKK
jgi:hypothetical protein